MLLRASYHRPSTQTRSWKLPLLFVVCLVCLAAPTLVAFVHASTSPLHAAWDEARSSGAYSYDARATVLHRPDNTLANVGLGSKEHQFAISGAVDQAKRITDIKLWSGNGSVHDGSAVELRIDGNRVLERGADGNWQQSATSLGAFAPGNDVFAFLSAARNVSAGERDSHNDVSFTRYTFTLDGRALAETLRAGVANELRRQGHTIESAPISAIESMLNMQGHGELWVGGDGLPLRQIITYTLPDKANAQTIESTVTTTFTNFAPLPMWRTIRLSAAVAWQPLLWHLTLLAGGLSLLSLLCRRPSRGLYAALAVAVVVITTANPLFQAAPAQAAERSTLQPQPAEQPAVPQAATTRDFHAPPAAPAPVMQLQTSTDSTDSDNDGLPNVDETRLGTNPSNADSDDDKIKDGMEVLEIGTNPLLADSDGDRLADNIEVKPLTGPDGRLWYLDPFQTDTNFDGLPDALEVIGGTPVLDTDNDKIPDAWDGDNDDDGVPDAIDTSPQHVVSGGIDEKGKLQGVPAQTLDFKLAGQNKGEPVSADFVIRPINPAHLWYNGNVLDWPSNDRSGQIQRVKDTTFGDTGKSANGDMRLTPMLEIEIPYQAGTLGGLPRKSGSTLTDLPMLPKWTGVVTQDQKLQNAWFDEWLDREKLDKFQITVRLKDDTRALLAYIPLDLMRDPQSNEPVAFKAKMFFRPITAAQLRANVRLSWTVQMLQDRCITPENQPTYCENPNNWTTVNNAAHVYYDDFVVSGMEVREDHGTSAAVIAQTEANGTSLFQAHLWNVAARLNNAFVAGRLDLTVAEIKQRFDSASNTGIAAQQRWNIPQNAFNVDTHSFDDQAELAKLTLGYRENNQDKTPLVFSLLNRTYVGDNAAYAANPTVLVAYERRFRLADISQQAQIGNGTISYNLSTAAEKTQAGINWNPLKYKGAGIWENVAIPEYTTKLRSTYVSLLRDIGGTVGGTPEQANGGAAFAEMLYLAYLNGHSRVVASNGVATTNQSTLPTDAHLSFDTYPTAAQTLGNTIAAMATLVTSYQQQRTTLSNNSAATLLDAMGRARLHKDAAPGLTLLEGLGDISQDKSENQMLAAAVAGTVSVFKAGDGSTASTRAFKVISMSIDSADTIKDTILLVKDLAGLSGDIKAATKTMLATLKGLSKAAVALEVVAGVVVAVVKILEIFTEDGLGGWDIFFGVVDALVDGAATIAVGLFLTALAGVVPIGTIVAALIAAVDLLIAGFCKIASWAGADFIESKFFSDYLCEGIAGNLAKLLSAIVYSDVPVIDMDEQGRINPTNWQITPTDPKTGQNTGYMHGNIMRVQADIKTTLNGSWEGRLRSLNGKFFFVSEFRQVMDNSTFRYEFTTNEEDGEQMLHERRQLETKQMEQAWQFISYNNIATSQTISTTVPLAVTGINWKVPSLFLAEGYAMPGLRCVVAVCGPYTKRDTSYINVADNFIFDVFPANLDAFYALTDRGNGGFALGWDAKFPILVDADGDGLRSTAKGGNDPSDNTPDTDSDGLTDFYELQQAAQGFNPTKPDTDGDGLNDAAEARLGTNPAQADQDGDGLNDKEEIDGWEIVYGYDAANQPLRFRTGSNPRDVDTDKDGILDKQEKTYGFNPRVFNSGTVLTILTQVDERDGIQDGFVADVSTIGYTSAITNTLRDRYALGLYEVGLPAEASASTLQPQSYLLGPRQQATMSGTLSLRDLPTSQKMTLVTRAGAIISDQRALAGGRVLWLHLDEQAGTPSFADSSTYNHHAVCADPGTCPSTGITGYAGRAFHMTQSSTPGPVLVVNSTPALNSDHFSISLWVKKIDLDKDAILVAKQNTRFSYELALDDGFVIDSPKITIRNACGTVTELDSYKHVDDGWSLVTATYDGTTLRIFVNGLEAASRQVAIGSCQQNAGPLTIGKGDIDADLGLDEVSVYPFALKNADILAQFRDPILRLNFDGVLADSSQFNQNVMVKGQDQLSRPSRESGQAVRFDKKRWITIGPDPDLDLSRGSGNFTLAAWIKPEPQPVDRNRWSWLGIMGRNSGSSSYPSLEMQFINGRANGVMRTAFGNGSARCESAQTSAWLTPNEWQHVVVSFTGNQFIFFRNGVQVDALALPGNCAGNPRPASVSSFDIGRTTPNAQLQLLELYIVSEGDASPTAEYDAYWDGASAPFWSRDDLDDATDESEDNAEARTDSCGRGCYTNIGDTQEIGDDNEHTYQLLEDDGATNKGTDDDLEIEAKFRNTDISGGNDDATRTWSYNTDGEGTVKYRLWNDFFNGELDDILVYRYALTQQDAAALYNAESQSDALQLRFEEPPTTSLFRDGSGNFQHGLCTGNTCPTSGLGGRDGQAVRFNGGQVVMVPPRPALDLPNSFTVAAWVKLDNPNTAQRIVSKYDSDIGKGGFLLNVQNGKLHAEMTDRQGNEYIVQGGTVPAKTWTHIAITATAGGYLVGYVNGQEVARTGFRATVRAAVATGLPSTSAQDPVLWENQNTNNDGDSFTVTGDVSDIDYYDQDEASSVTITNACIDLYDGDDYATFMHVVCENTNTLGDHNRKTDSVKLYRTPPSTQNGALVLNSSNRQFVAITPKVIGAPNFSSITIGARIKMTVAGSRQVIAARGNNDKDFNYFADDFKVNNGFRFWIENAKLRFSAGNGVWSGNRTLDTNEHHVAVTLGNGEVRFYVDGQLDAVHGNAPSINDLPDRQILLGRGPDCGANPWCDFFNGQMRDVAMYTYPLNNAQISSLHADMPHNVGANGRVFYLPLDEANNTTSFGMLVSQPLGVNETPLTVGRSFGGIEAVTGLIDEVSVLETALTETGIRNLIQRAPVINLHLDEIQDAPSFANDATTNLNGSCIGTFCPKAEAKGRIRNALVFDGTNNMITMNDANVIDLNKFSIELWVRPSAQRSEPQPLVTKEDVATNTTNYTLAIAPNSMSVQLAACSTSLLSQKLLNQEQWNHIVATYDGAMLRLYLNGTLDNSVSYTGPACTNNKPLYLGAQPDKALRFAGMLDEVQVYGSVLREEDVQAHYQYQESWFDIAERHDLTIDADTPTVRVDLPENAVIANGDLQVAIVAQDATSPLKSVEYNIGDGWQTATRDHDIWIFTYTPPATATATILVRATDAVGHQSSSTRKLRIDSAPPTLTLDSALTSNVLRPVLDDAKNTWNLALNGTATDALSAPVSVVATLRDHNHETVGTPLMLANIDGLWSGSYHFPYPPTDRYTLEINAVDGTGHTTVLNNVVALDAAAPMADITVGATVLASGTGPQAQSTGGHLATIVAQDTTAPIVAPPVLRGTVVDAPIPDTSALTLHFEEAVGATQFLDGSRDQRLAQCDGAACPTAGIVGYAGNALTFDGLDDTLNIASNLTTTDATPRFTVAMWAKPGANIGDRTIFAGALGTAQTLQVRLNGSQLGVWMPQNNLLQHVGGGTLNANQWNHIALVFDGTEVTTYINGASITPQPYNVVFGGFDQFAIGGQTASGFYAGMLDELLVYSRTLSSDEISALANPVRSGVQMVEVRLVHLKQLDAPDPNGWQTANILQPNGVFTTWSYAIPTGIEGPYRVDLRTTDSKGNKTILPNLWNGEIDTKAPQVAFFAQPRTDGSSDVTCFASDYNLDDTSLRCPAPLNTWQQGYQTAEWYTSFFGTTPKLESIRGSAVVPAESTLRVYACDIYGNCATSDGSANMTIKPGASIVLKPSGKEIVNTFDPVDLRGYASAEAGLQSIEVTVGQSTIATPSVGSNQTELSWSTSFTPLSEGIYPVQARMQDKNGGVYTDTLAPVLVVDVAPPVLALRTTVLTSTAMLSSGRVTIGGLVTETHGLQTLEASMDNHPWGTLSLPSRGTAVPFNGQITVGAGPFDGQQMELSLRARDLADRNTVLVQTVTLDTVAPQSRDLLVTPSTTEARIAGIATDGLGVRAVEVGLLSTQDRDHPERTLWRLAELDQALATSTNWHLMVPAGDARSFTIALRLTDTFGNQQTISNVWSGDLIKLAPQFTSSAPAAAIYSGSYQHTFVASGDPTISYTISSGTLPPGLDFDGATGVLNGTPNLAGSYTFAVTASSLWKPDAVQMVTLVVEKVPLAVTIADQTRIYGQANPVFTYSVENSHLVNGDSADVVTGMPKTDANERSSVGTYTITAGTLQSTNYALSITTGTLNIQQAPLMVTAERMARKVGTPNPALILRYTGFVNGDGADDLDIAPTVATIATEASPIGTYPITVEGGKDNNYKLSYENGVLDVVAKDVPKQDWDIPTAITYGEALSSLQLNATASFNGLPVAGTWVYDPPLGTVLHVGNGQILNATFTPDDEGTYASVTASVQIDVMKAPLTITARNTTMVEGQPVPQLTYGITGFVNGDTEANLVTPVVITTTVTTDSPVGTHDIILRGGTSPDYTTILVRGSLSVERSTPTLIVTSGSHAAPGSFVVFFARGFLPNEEVQIAVRNIPALKLRADANGRLTFALVFNPDTADGSYTISASSANVPSGTAPREANTIVVIDGTAVLQKPEDNKMLNWANALPTLYFPHVIN